MKAFVIKEGFVENGITFKIGDEVELTPQRYEQLKGVWIEDKPREVSVAKPEQKSVLKSKKLK